MTKRAAIYIRVSSERQADRVSPEAQEADCRSHCEHQGYAVVEIFRDIERYRAGSRMVEPSGSRADRPGLKAMLTAAYEERFDVIVAWREDRLYRSYRPMLDVLDTLDATKVDIELVKESFDKKIAPVKAWAARMELDAKHDRTMMGVAGRLERGKAWNHPPPYGYSKSENGEYVVNPDEAQWVQKLFCWYGEGLSYGEIRQRFVSGGAPPRRENNRRVWPVQLLCRYLKAEHYWCGYHAIKWNGEIYEIPMPPLVTVEEVQLVKDRQAQYKRYPAGNAKHDALAAGLVYCTACGTAMYVHTRKSGYTRKRDGKRKVWVGYLCSSYGNQVPTPDCVRRVQVKQTDAKIWAKLWDLIGNPGELEQAIQRRVEELRAVEFVAEKDLVRLERELNDLGMERQRVITLARKGIIRDDDLSQQLYALDIQVKALEREAADAKLLTGDKATQLLQLAHDFRRRIQEGFADSNVEPQNIEETKRQQAYKRKLVQTLVARAWVNPDQTINLKLTIDLGELAEINQPVACYQYSDSRNFVLTVIL